MSVNDIVIPSFEALELHGRSPTTMEATIYWAIYEHGWVPTAVLQKTVEKRGISGSRSPSFGEIVKAAKYIHVLKDGGIKTVNQPQAEVVLANVGTKLIGEKNFRQVVEKIYEGKHRLYTPTLFIEAKIPNIRRLKDTLDDSRLRKLCREVEGAKGGINNVENHIVTAGAYSHNPAPLYCRE